MEQLSLKDCTGQLFVFFGAGGRSPTLEEKSNDVQTTCENKLVKRIAEEMGGWVATYPRSRRRPIGSAPGWGSEGRLGPQEALRSRFERCLECHPHPGTSSLCPMLGADPSRPSGILYRKESIQRGIVNTDYYRRAGRTCARSISTPHGRTVIETPGAAEGSQSTSRCWVGQAATAGCTVSSQTDECQQSSALAAHREDVIA